MKTLVFLLFYFISSAYSHINIDIKLLYADNISEKESILSINSLCEIHPHHFLILSDDKILRLYSLEFNYIEHQTMVPYDNPISSVRCNGRNGAYLLSSDSHILSKILFSIDKHNKTSLSRYDYTFGTPFKPLCFHFYDFLKSFDKIIVIISDLSYYIIDFTNGVYPIELSQNIPINTGINSIIQCDLNRFNQEYLDYLISYSISLLTSYDHYGILSLIHDNYNIFNEKTLKFSSLTTIPSKNIFSLLNLESYKIENYDKSNNLLESQAFLTNFDGHSLLSQWSFGSDTYLFSTDKSILHVYQFNGSMIFKMFTFFELPFKYPDESITFFRILTGKPAIIQIGTNKGTIFLYNLHQIKTM